MSEGCEARVASAYAILMLGSGWLLTRLWCFLGLPKDCDLADDGLDLISNIVILLAFGIAQAWFCGILCEAKFKGLLQTFYFPLTFYAIGPIVSALQDAEGIPSVEVRQDEFTDTESTLSIIFFAIVIFFILWHLLMAWRELPGMALVSGTKSSGEKPTTDANSRFGYYMISRSAVLILFIVSCVVLYVNGDGWGYRYILLSWLLSLLAHLNNPVSTFWLAATTGVFVQGVGAYGVNFLLPH